MAEGKEDGKKKFVRPGALHKAWWMSKLLYTTEMVLLSTKISDLPRGTVFASGQLDKILRFVQFVMYCYIPWWLTAPVSSAAPLNYLTLINNLIEYQGVDKVCADAAIKAFSAHLWYLTEELVPLALYSSAVDPAIKAKMADGLLQLDKKLTPSKRFGAGYGKPRFPKFPQTASSSLESFIGEDSWSFFGIMRLDPAFLQKPVADWLSDISYLDGQKTIDSLSVVNDGAEREVKLAHDFLGQAKKEGNL